MPRKNYSVTDDSDFLVALKGFTEGVLHFDDVLIDNSFEIFKKWSANFAFAEKEELHEYHFTPQTIEQMISEWQEPAAYKNKFPTKLT